MNRVRRAFLSILLIITLIPFGNTASAAEFLPDFQQEATVLSELGLFKGSSNGFELDRIPTRAEAAVMLVRLLGEETVAQEKQYSHPFTDVPEWASNYVGYLYEMKLTNGIGNNLFGSAHAIVWKDYCTFVLRSLEYDDSNGDFTYAASVDKAIELGLLNSAEGTFLRDDMVGISFAALKTQMKDGGKTLAQTLVDAGAISKADASKEGIITNISETITATFSNPKPSETYKGYNTHTIKLNRSELPKSIQDFYYLTVQGGNPNTPKDKFNALMSAVKYGKGYLTEAIYSDENGVSNINYGYCCLYFWDKDSNIIARCILQAVDEGKVTAACDVLSAEDFVNPDTESDVNKTASDIDTKFMALNLIEFNSSALVVFTNPYFSDTITTYIKRQELPAKLQGFVNICVCQFSKETDNDLQIKKTALNFASGCLMKYNTAGYSSLKIDTEKNVMVLLYDNQGILMGYHVLADVDFIKKADCFVDCSVTFESEYFSPENSSQSRALINSFTLTRKINGVVDPDFIWQGGCTSQNHIRGSEYINGLTFQFLYYEPGYTYEFVSSDPNVQIQNVTMTKSSY